MDEMRDHRVPPPSAAPRFAIDRRPAAAARETHDVAIVGGGIYGICLLLEAVRRNLRAVLLEQADFGGGTTFNHLRTLHGGLRYLQTADLPRFFESVAERRWYLQHFPEHTRPLPCLMPLYGDGLRKPFIFRAALALNDALSAGRNAGVSGTHGLPASRLVRSDEVRRLFPSVRPGGLRGGAVWHDAVIAAPQRLVLELLRRACAAGGVALNHVRATALLTAGGAVAGVRARDELAGEDLEFRASRVYNAAGPWGPGWLRELGLESEGLCAGALLLWNVLYDRPALSDHALALSPGRGGHTYFVHPWQGRLLVGTGEKPVSVGAVSAAPDRRDLESFRADLRAAVPALDLQAADELRVYSGVLPATRSGKLTRRPGVIDHGRRGGHAGLVSVCGIKFTTARRTADDLLRAAFPARAAADWASLPRPAPPPDSGRCAFDGPDDLPPARCAALAALARDEAAEHLSDLLLRRTDLGDRPSRARAWAPALAEALYSDPPRRAVELQRLEAELAAGAAPAGTGGA